MPLEAIDVERIGAAFHDQHDRLFGYASPEMPIEVLAARVTLVGSTTKPEPTPFEGGVGDADAARTGSRPVWSPAVRAMRETPVYDGLALAAGASLDGPAIVELANTTIVVLDAFHLSVDRLGAFVVAREHPRTGAGRGDRRGRMDRLSCGVVGVGVLGRGITTSLARAGLPVVVHDVDPAAAEAAAAEPGIRRAATVASLAAESDVVLLVLPDTPEVLEVADELAQSLRAGSVGRSSSAPSPPKPPWSSTAAWGRSASTCSTARSAAAQAVPSAATWR